MTAPEVLAAIGTMQRDPIGRTLSHRDLLKVLELVELHRAVDLLQQAVLYDYGPAS